MTRLALVRVKRPGLGWPGQDPAPTAIIGWYTTRAPRRYAVVTDLAAWTAWVKGRRPEHVGDCGHVDHAFESGVRKMAAQLGGCIDPQDPNRRIAIWREPGIEGPAEVVPGLVIRADSAVRIHVTTPDGSIDSWESPVDVTPEGVPA